MWAHIVQQSPPGMVLDGVIARKLLRLDSNPEIASKFAYTEALAPEHVRKWVTASRQNVVGTDATQTLNNNLRGYKGGVVFV